MNLLIKNTGIIKNAEIAFNGLTVIAGKNDTGKSTVGKLMFAIVKAFSRFEQDLNEDKKKHIFEAVRILYFKIRKNYSFEKYPKLKEDFYPRFFFKEIETLLDSDDFEKLKFLLEGRKEFFKKTQIEHNINELENLIFQNEDKKFIVKRALTKALVSEFHFEISPKGFRNLKSFISLSEGANDIFKIEIENNKVTELEFYDEVFFNDVTFVETPTLLQMYDVVNSASTLLEIIDGENKEPARR